jgi:ParB-like chromosome segregation protein Spo0J
MAKSVINTLAIEPTKDISRFRDFFSTRKDLGGFMDPRLIRIEKGHNPRDYKLLENRAHLDSLKVSIATAGVRQPLLCRLEGGQCILVDGESRLTAVLELINEGAEILTIPVMQVTANTAADRIAIAVGANTGKPLSEWELGGAFKRLSGFGWDNEQIAAQFGITSQKVAKCIEMADMPQDVKQLLSERAITPALAISTIKKARTQKGSTVESATQELKDEVAKRKAKGMKGPAKAAKKAAKVVGSAAEQLLRLIFESFETEYFQEKNQDGGFGSEYFAVKLGHAKKMEKLVYPDGK